MSSSMAGDVSTWGHALVKISLSVSSLHLGEEQKKLDVLSNEVFSKALKFLTELIMIFMRVWIFFHCILISEEEEETKHLWSHLSVEDVCCCHLLYTCFGVYILFKIVRFLG